MIKKDKIFNGKIKIVRVLKISTNVETIGNYSFYQYGYYANYDITDFRSGEGGTREFHHQGGWEKQ